MQKLYFHIHSKHHLKLFINLNPRSPGLFPSPRAPHPWMGRGGGSFLWNTDFQSQTCMRNLWKIFSQSTKFSRTQLAISLQNSVSVVDERLSVYYMNFNEANLTSTNHYRQSISQLVSMSKSEIYIYCNMLKMWYLILIVVENLLCVLHDGIMGAFPTIIPSCHGSNNSFWLPLPL